MKYLFIIYLISLGWINPLLLLLLLAMQMAWLIFYLGWKTSTNCKWIIYIWMNPLIITILLVNDIQHEIITIAIPIRYSEIAIGLWLYALFTLTAVELNVFFALHFNPCLFFLTSIRRKRASIFFNYFFRHSIYVMIKIRISLNYEQSFMLQPLMVFI